MLLRLASVVTNQLACHAQAFSLYKGTDLCLRILSENNNKNILSTIESFLDVMESSYGRSYRRKHKNKLHTYLSSSDEYVTMPLGTASSAGAFDWDSDELESLKCFLVEGFRY